MQYCLLSIILGKFKNYVYKFILYYLIVEEKI